MIFTASTILWAREAHFTSNFISAEQAEQWGLVMERRVMSHVNRQVPGGAIGARREAVQERGKTQK